MHSRSVKVVLPAIFYIIAARREKLKSLEICKRNCASKDNSVDPGVTIFVLPYSE